MAQSALFGHVESEHVKIRGLALLQEANSGNEWVYHLYCSQEEANSDQKCRGTVAFQP